MEIVRRAIVKESFSLRESTSSCPCRDPRPWATVDQLTMIPRPIYPYEIWQAVTSPPTLEYVPIVGHGAVFWNQHPTFIKRSGTATRSATRQPSGDAPGGREAHARRRDPDRRHPRTGVDRPQWPRRVLEVPRPVRLEPRVHWPDGKPAKPGLIPTLEESMEQDDPRRHPRRGRRGGPVLRDLLGIEHLTIFPHLLGDPYKGRRTDGPFHAESSPSSVDCGRVRCGSSEKGIGVELAPLCGIKSTEN